MSVAPTLRTERALLRDGIAALACVDEVGRGALAGPVTVGVTVLTLEVGTAPKGLRDSKLLTPAARVALLPRLRRWPVAHAVGHAQSHEIDRVGILAALRVAAARAFQQLPLAPDLTLLDGSHNWLRVPEEPEGLFPDPRSAAAAELADLAVLPELVTTRVKADLTCAGVAAASVLAKCARDAIMVELAGQHPVYGWAVNKGYSAPEHVDALREHGPCALHRRSWHLPGVAGDAGVLVSDDGGEAGLGAEDPPGHSGDLRGAVSGPVVDVTTPTVSPAQHAGRSLSTTSP